MLNKQRELFASEHIYIEQIFYKQAQYNKNTLCANPHLEFSQKYSFHKAKTAILWRLQWLYDAQKQKIPCERDVHFGMLLITVHYMALKRLNAMFSDI